MPSKKSKAGGAVLGTTSDEPRKKRVAVDQYMARNSTHSLSGHTARTLLDEIPMRIPRKGEIVPQPATLPTMMLQTAQNEFYCEVCRATCNSFRTLKEHQGGKVHRKHVLISAIKSHRFLNSMF